MATATPRNQGKTEFVRSVLDHDPRANAQAVKDAWQKSGHEGTISETLVNKMRSEMGLAGNLRGGRPKGSKSATSERPKYTGKKRGRKPKSAQVAPSNGRSVEEPRARTGSRQNQLTALEADIDLLLFKVMNLGGLEEIETSLRKTRRLLYGAITGS
jgi:hypothetical protein